MAHEHCTADSCIFCFHSDEEELRKSFSELGDSLCDSNASKSMKQVGSSEEPLPVGSEPSGMLLYKNGFLVRKVHADSDGKRSTKGHISYTLPLIRAGLPTDEKMRKTKLPPPAAETLLFTCSSPINCGLSDKYPPAFFTLTQLHKCKKKTKKKRQRRDS